MNRVLQLADHPGGKRDEIRRWFLCGREPIRQPQCDLDPRNWHGRRELDVQRHVVAFVDTVVEEPRRDLNVEGPHQRDPDHQCDEEWSAEQNRFRALQRQPEEASRGAERGKAGSFGDALVIIARPRAALLLAVSAQRPGKRAPRPRRARVAPKARAAASGDGRGRGWRSL